jgi:hypothetical protein
MPFSERRNGWLGRLNQKLLDSTWPHRLTLSDDMVERKPKPPTVTAGVEAISWNGKVIDLALDVSDHLCVSLSDLHAALYFLRA